MLALLLGVQTLLHRWGADVWEHAAVVHTVAESLADPDHPILPVDAPHPFIVPSAFLGAAIVAGTGMAPLEALVLVAGLNLSLLLAGIWLFVTGISCGSQWVPSLALAFALFLWGLDPWGYSGFLHLNQIGQSLPYPSAFGFGCALLTLATYGRWIESPGAVRLVACLVLAPLVILSHPVASILLCTGVAALLVKHLHRVSAWGGAAGMGLASLAATLLWPYYPYWSLVEASPVFDASNRVLYNGALLRTGPLLAGFAVVIGRLRRDRRDPLALTVLGLTGIYVAGFVLERWSLGRVVSPLAFLLQVALADWIGARIGPFVRGITAPGLRGLSTRAAAVLLVGLAMVNMAPGFARTLPPALLPRVLAEDERLAPIDRRHRFLAAHLESGDVVLARAKTGWPVPAYGGKILAPAHAQAFVDTTALRADVEAFFAPDTDRAARRRIVDRHDARWVLIDAADPLAARVLPEIRRMSELVTEEEGLYLLSISETRP